VKHAPVCTRRSGEAVFDNETVSIAPQFHEAAPRLQFIHEQQGVPVAGVTEEPKG